MKNFLLQYFLFFVTSIAMSQVVANQIDDFEDGTTMNWEEGNVSPNPPMNISTDGPAGVNDNYIQNDSSGGGGAGSKMVYINDAQWSGNFTAQGIIAVRFNARVFTNNLNLRIAMDGDGGAFSTTNAVMVNANSGWTEVTIPIMPSDFTPIGTASSIEQTLAGCDEFRIIHHDSPSFTAQSVNARLELDNITALTALSVDDITSQREFKIVSNPSDSKLVIQLPPDVNDARLDIFDVLGKKVVSKQLTGLTATLDVSKWNNGVYLVRITSDNSTQTKRFVKQ